MTDPWNRLQSAAVNSLNWIWFTLAKQGMETGVLARMGESPKAAGWLAGCMSMNEDEITRKIGAMLAGFIRDEAQKGLLLKMLDREREVFLNDELAANSVVEDIVLSATRWTSATGIIGMAGQQVLAKIVEDVLNGTPWNSAHWAASNLFLATNGDHKVLRELASMTSELNNQPFLAKTAKAICNGDIEAISRTAVTPPQIIVLPPDFPEVHLAFELWDAVKDAEIEAQKP